MGIIKAFAQICVLILSTAFTSAQVTSMEFFPLPGVLSCPTGPNPATGVSIGVTDCTSAPCKFVLGKSYTFSVYAASGVNTNTTPYSVTAAFPSAGTYKFLEGNGCDVLRLGYGPVRNGYLYLADLTYHLDTYTPTGYAVVEINVRDDFQNVIICAQFFALVAAS